MTALFACDKTYEWRDQSYAFAKMEGSLCITEKSGIRARAFLTAEAALVALDDEMALLPSDTEIAIGEKMYVAASGENLKRVINAYPHLDTITRAETDTSHGTTRDERDVCVGMLAAHFDSAVGGDATMLQGYAEVYPHAARAAASSARSIETNASDRERLAQLRSDDPFAYDVWLSDRVSPLKPLCA
ncbi:hypothetical protein [Microbacterium testaceum]|uniref:hypothetical protein n=1 Tax=Microbacterium testaceum TaxID=2033 RepID=UPI00381CC819